MQCQEIKKPPEGGLVLSATDYSGAASTSSQVCVLFGQLEILHFMPFVVGLFWPRYGLQSALLCRQFADGGSASLNAVNCRPGVFEKA